MKHLREITMILRPNVEGQGVLNRTEEGAEAYLLYLRYVSIWGKKEERFFSNQRTSTEVPSRILL